LQQTKPGRERGLLTEKQITGSEKVYVSTLPNGIYIVKLVTDSGTKIQKVIKQ
jgi:hypothetical protein